MPLVQILVVEDENIVALDIQGSLNRLGYAVPIVVSSGEAAIQKAEETRPDLVLMDIVLKGKLDGIEAAAIIRTHLNIPVIFLTAHADELTLQRAKITEPFGYVLKPFEERELHITIEIALVKNRMERRLRESERWLATTLNSIGDGLIATDREGCITFMNAMAHFLTGWEPEEAVGNKLNEVLYLLNEETRQPVTDLISQVLKQGRSINLDRPLLLIGRNGNERVIEDSVAPIRDGQGKIQGIVLVFRDVGERRRLEGALRQRVEELAETARRKDEFLAMLSHELRNPLAPLLNALHVLRMPSTEQPAREEMQNMMDRQIRRLSRLVDDLLDVSRITRGLVQLRMENLDLNTVVARAVETARPLIESRAHQLTLCLPPGPVPLWGDSLRLEQVVANLLNNAAKYTEPGGKIVLSAQRKNQEIVLRVRDNGLGIEPQMIPQIFNLFAQADRSLERTYGGLGIGLTVVRSLVEKHGGSAEAHSPGLGQGSEFIIRLPVSSLEKDSSQTRAVGSGLVPSPTGLRILVVDDSVDTAESLALLLTSWGHDARIVHNGLEVLPLARSFRPEAVLLDIGLPGMDGFAVAEELRRDSTTAKALLFALTGYGQEQDLRRSLEAGFDKHLTKPVDPEELKKLLTPLAEKKRTGDEPIGPAADSLPRP